MRGPLAAGAGAWLLFSVVLTGTDFWQEKPFAAWSAQQVEKMLTESPWAKKVTVVIGTIREGNFGVFESGGAGVGGGGGGASHKTESDDPAFQQIRRLPVNVIWISALPVRQALLRRQAGLGTQITPEQQRQLSEDEPFYTLVVFGLPMRLATRLGTLEDLTAATSLKPNGKERIAPGDVRVSRDGDQFFRVELLFPKSDPIALGDKEVAFTTKLGDVEVARKFKLAEMTIGGKLAL
jgi:hypothetical protein